MDQKHVMCVILCADVVSGFFLVQVLPAFGTVQGTPGWLVVERDIIM